MATAGQDVETLLGEEPPNPKEAWRRLKGWYKAEVNRSPPPARATLKRIMSERVDLYSYLPYPGENILVNVTPSEVNDSVHMEDEIGDAVKKPRRNRSGGGLGMRAENLKGRLVASNRRKMAAEKGEDKTEEEEERGDRWGKLVELIQTAFREGDMAEEATWQTVVLIPKGKK